MFIQFDECQIANFGYLIFLLKNLFEDQKERNKCIFKIIKGITYTLLKIREDLEMSREDLKKAIEDTVIKHKDIFCRVGSAICIAFLD